jgi:agmatine/peptidylarginine deiminase
VTAREQAIEAGAAALGRIILLRPSLRDLAAAMVDEVVPIIRTDERERAEDRMRAAVDAVEIPASDWLRHVGPERAIESYRDSVLLALRDVT